MHFYDPLDVTVRTPLLTLVGASDQWLASLAPLVRAGKADAIPDPYDDPMSLYERDPDLRVARWLQGVWRGRGTVRPDFWRLYFVVVVDDEPVGMQDIIGQQFGHFGSAVTFSWLSADLRGRGLRREMREAALHLVFAGLDAREAVSEAFLNNQGSNRVSAAMGYQPNGTTWATRRGEPAVLQRWRIAADEWEIRRRDDIHTNGVDSCRRLLGI